MLIQDLNVDNHNYRYLNTVSRLSGANGKYQRTDAENGQVLIQESASNKLNSETGLDYSDAYTVVPIGSTYTDRDSNTKTNGYRVELFAPKDFNGNLTGRIWTHYSVYRTQDLNDPTVDLANATETYIWTKDVQMVKQFHIISVTSGILALYDISGNTGGERLTQDDEGATIKCTDGSEYLIVKVTSETRAIVTDPYGAQPETNIGPIYGHIGNGTQFVMSRIQRDDNTAEYYWVDNDDDPGESIIGNEIIFKSGELGIIKYYNKSGDTITLGVEEINGVPEATRVGILSLHLAVVNPTSRVFTDTTSDEVLQGRKVSGEPLYFLQTRFFDALPNGKLSAISGGAYFTTTYQKSEYYYCSLRNLYRAGYYQPSFQYNDKPKSKITRLKEYPGLITIFGQNFTYYLDTSVIQDAGENAVGEYIPTFSDPRLITENVGLHTEGNAAGIDNGGEVIFTNEPGVRFFNGYEFSDNIADGLVQNTRIARFNPSLVMSWSKKTGLNITGIAEVLTNDAISRANLTVYYGESVLESLNEAQIKSLRATKLTDTFVGVYNFIDGGYNYICYPSIWGSNVYIEDNDKGYNIAYPDSMYTVVTVDGLDYNVFRTSYVLNGTISFKVKEV